MVLTCHINEAGYAKNDPVLRDIQFKIRPGELVGLIGPNGAGKSTTIKTILGTLEHVDADINMLDYSYIPEQPIYYDGLTLWEHIYFLMSTLDISEEQLISEAKYLLHMFNLFDVADQYIDSFSKGMRQKVMILIAFLQKSSVHIIDEPFTGLDPRTTKQMLQLINEEKSRGAGILMSTHILDTAEKICDRFVLISQGELLIQGTLKEIQVASGISDGSLFDCFYELTDRDLSER